MAGRGATRRRTPFGSVSRCASGAPTAAGGIVPIRSSGIMAYSSPISVLQASAREREPMREVERRKKLRPSDVLVRAATTELLRQQTGPNHLEPFEDVLSRVFADCPATSFYLKAATNPAATTTATWAAELVDQSVADFIANEMPQSAFAQLSQRAMTVTPRPGVGVIKIPSRTSPQVLSGAWLAEGSAKPVFQGSLTSTDLTPYKLAALSSFTEEMLNSTQIEQILREVLSHDLTALLDSALLDATAASATRPAGLWNGATAVTASAATPPSEAMMVDLKTLAAAVSSGNPDARVVYVTNPAQAIRVNITSPTKQDNVITSGYMAAGSVGAVDANAIAMLVSQPEFALSRNAALHMENTAPLPIATGVQGSATVAAPTRSMFQEDAVALRCVLRASWAKRRTGCTALATSVTW
jgi:hypothetical protein